MSALLSSSSGLAARPCAAQRTGSVKPVPRAARRARCVAPRAVAAPEAPQQHAADFQRPDSTGRFGRFGGRYVPETLIVALDELEREYERARADPSFQVRASGGASRRPPAAIVRCTGRTG